MSSDPFDSGCEAETYGSSLKHFLGYVKGQMIVIYYLHKCNYVNNCKFCNIQLLKDRNIKISAYTI